VVHGGWAHGLLIPRVRVEVGQRNLAGRVGALRRMILADACSLV